jgi:DNA-binding winged helix-turn-helix (wHTH) protein
VPDHSTLEQTIAKLAALAQAKGVSIEDLIENVRNRGFNVRRSKGTQREGKQAKLA